MKKLGLLVVALLVLAACGSTKGSKTLGSIKVYTRDSASGTREAFESIIGLKDALTADAAETSGSGDMAAQVGDTEAGIGYVSLSTDFKANKLKPLKYENVEATVDTINKGEYTLARPFSFVTRAQGDFDSEDKEALVLAFVDYLENSKEGRQVVLAAGGIVDVEGGQPWDTLKANHPIVSKDNSQLTLKTGGSTSVEATLNKAVESFIPLAGNFKYEPNHTGSSAGFERTLGKDKDSANSADIGFASRAFKSEETVDLGLSHGAYAKDAVVVVVNEKNTEVENVTQAQLVDIFSGKIKEWSELSAR